MTTRHGRFITGALGAALLASVAAGCGGGTGGGSGQKGNPEDQFVLNSNNSGRLILNVDPTEVDANKSDRIGLVATLTDRLGNPIPNVTIVFSSDIPDVSFLPGRLDGASGRNVGFATTDAHGNATTIARAGSTPTGTGNLIGSGAIFAVAPAGFGLSAQQQVTILDIGFIDSEAFGVIPMMIDLVEPSPGSVVFFNIVGGTPPYDLQNESSGIGVATLGQHCVPGCTENSSDAVGFLGQLCVGSPCQSDGDCNEGGSSTPSDVCIGPIKRCLASCQGTNCGGSRCDTDADCNDGAPSPAGVCRDSGQSIVYVVRTDQIAGSHVFSVEDSAGNQKDVTVNVTFVCGNGIARGGEACDLGDVRDATCESLGFPGGGVLQCNNVQTADDCTFNVENCLVTSPSPGTSPGAETPTPGGPTDTPTETATPTPSVTPTATVSPTSTATPGAAQTLVLSLLTNGSGDNGDTTLTTVIAATVTDMNSLPVADNTQVTWAIIGSAHGATVSPMSATNQNPPCNVTNFQTDTGVMVMNQAGVAHACIIYPPSSAGMTITVQGLSGTANDADFVILPNAPP